MAFLLEQRDLLAQKTGLADNSIDYVLLFNILHHESPLDFLHESYRLLKHNGQVGIISWRSDIETPRGPDLGIRPKPGQILQWIDKSKFIIYKEPVIIELYHYGLVLSKI